MMDFYEEHSGDKQLKKDLLGVVCESGGRQCNEDLLGVVQEVIRRQVAIGGSLMRSTVQEIIWRQVAIEGSVRRSAGGHLAAGSYMRIAQAQCRWSSGGKYKGGGRLCNPRISIRSSRGSTCRDTLEERRIYFSFIPNQNEHLAKAIPEKKQNFAWVFSKNHKKPLY